MRVANRHYARDPQCTLKLLQAALMRLCRVPELWRDGEQFNKDNHSRYEYNEVYLKSGKKVDAYNEDSEIVERKNTQLAEVKEDIAKSYIDPLRYKYKSGEIIGDTPKNRNDGIAKKTLKGDHIFEVPPQNGPVPKNILDYATKHNVTIWDTNGKLHN